MKTYTIYYLVDGYWETPKEIKVQANNKADAYTKAVYDLLIKIEGREPYAAYVDSVEYSNGRIRIFNNCFGDAY